MSIIKKISILLLLSAVMTFSFYGCKSGDKNNDEDFSFEAPAPEDTNTTPETYAGFSYVFTSEGTVTITGYESIAKNAVIPEKINNCPVTKIAERACYENTDLHSVEIPDSITVIEAEAFSGCTSLAEVKMGKSIAEIDGRAFDKTPFLDNLTDEFVILGDNILLRYNGSDENVTVPNGVKYISSAFEDNALVASITLPDTVTTIGSYAFTSCISLRSITISEGVTSIGMRAFAKCISLAEINIPDSVTKIGVQCYLYCSSAESIRLSQSLKAIPTSAFQACSSVTSVIIPASVEAIGDQAFLRCSSLSSVTVPSSVAEIGSIAFSHCDKDLTVTCPSGSAIEDYCVSYGIKIAH